MIWAYLKTGAPFGIATVAILWPRGIRVRTVTPSTVLPMQIFLWSDEVDRGFVEKTSAAIIVLLIVLLSMNALAIYLRNKFEKRW